MQNITDLLLSKEILIVYIILGIAILLCLLIYIIDKITYKSKLKKNTLELIDLVNKVNDKLANTSIPTSSILEDNSLSDTKRVEINNNDLSYTNIEPTREEAIREIEAIKEELVKEETSTENDTLANSTFKNEEVVDTVEEIDNSSNVCNNQGEETINNSDTDNIISNQYDDEDVPITLDEYMMISTDKYNNDTLEISDEEDALISFDEVSKKFDRVNNEIEEITSPVGIELQNVIESVYNNNKEEAVILENKVVEMHTLSDLSEPERVRVPYMRDKFRNSNFISPIFGLEKANLPTLEELQIENTANYDKLDQEIKKTNNFLKELHELKKNLED